MSIGCHTTPPPAFSGRLPENPADFARRRALEAGQKLPQAAGSSLTGGQTVKPNSLEAKMMVDADRYLARQSTPVVLPTTSPTIVRNTRANSLDGRTTPELEDILRHQAWIEQANHDNRRDSTGSVTYANTEELETRLRGEQTRKNSFSWVNTFHKDHPNPTLPQQQMYEWAKPEKEKYLKGN